MKDNECLDTSSIQSVVIEMMNEFKENERKNFDPLTEFVDFDDETYVDNMSGGGTFSTNNLTFN